MNKNSLNNQYIIVLILTISLILKLYLSQFGGYEIDINYFRSWSQEVYTNGFSTFYQNTNSDYPPLYIYVLWIIGVISSIFNTDSIVLLKFPAIFSDIISSYLIYLIIIKYSDNKTALISMILYLFNPANIFTSSIWGQIDSFYVSLLLLSVYEFISERPYTSGIFLILSVLTKPQSIIILPIFFVIYYKKYKEQMILKITTPSLILFLLLSKPFYSDVSDVFKLYFNSYSEYPYTSLNAFNFWALFGMFKPDGTLFLFISYRLWGYILFGLLVAYIIYRVIKTEDHRFMYISSFMMFLGFYMLFTRIHERYMFPVFAFLIISCVFYKKLYYIYFILMTTFFLSLYLVYEEVRTGLQIPMSMIIIPYITIINIIVFIYLCYDLTQKDK